MSIDPVRIDTFVETGRPDLDTARWDAIRAEVVRDFWNDVPVLLEALAESEAADHLPTLMFVDIPENDDDLHWPTSGAIGRLAAPVIRAMQKYIEGMSAVDAETDRRYAQEMGL